MCRFKKNCFTKRKRKISEAAIYSRRAIWWIILKHIERSRSELTNNPSTNPVLPQGILGNVLTLLSSCPFSCMNMFPRQVELTLRTYLLYEMSRKNFFF